MHRMRRYQFFYHKDILISEQSVLQSEVQLVLQGIANRRSLDFVQQFAFVSYRVWT